MNRSAILPFLAGFATCFILARIPTTRQFLTGGNKFFG